MDNAQRAIMIGVGLFIAIIIISAVLLITNMGVGLIKKSEGDIGNITAQLQSEISDKYSGAEYSGAEVLEIVKNYYNSTKICVLVVSQNGISTSAYSIAGAGSLTLSTTSVSAVVAHTPTQPLAPPYSVIGASGSEIIYGTIGTIPKTSLLNFTNLTSVNYINPDRMYDSSVIKSRESDAIIGIAFRRI